MDALAAIVAVLVALAAIIGCAALPLWLLDRAIRRRYDPEVWVLRDETERAMRDWLAERERTAGASLQPREERH